MSTPTTPPGIPVPSAALTTPKQKTPSFATRRAACTHLTVERLYGGYFCNICRNPGDCGYVYVCTQDHGELFSPDAVGRVVVDPAKPGGKSKQSVEASFGRGEKARLPSAELSPWMEKAIARGEYTEEQITIIRRQKQHVVDITMTAIARFEQEEAARHSPTPFPSPTPTESSSSTISTESQIETETSLDTNPHLPYPLIHSVDETNTQHSLPTVTVSRVIPDSQITQPATPQKKRKQPSSDTSPKSQTPRQDKGPTRLFPYCTFLACQTCRPTYRDRAWVRIEDALAVPASQLPRLETFDEESFRPEIASAVVARGIGLTKPSTSSSTSKGLWYNHQYMVRDAVEKDLQKLASDKMRGTAEEIDITDANAIASGGVSTTATTSSSSASPSASTSGLAAAFGSPKRPPFRRSSVRSSIRRKVKRWIERRDSESEKPASPDSDGAKEEKEDDKVLDVAAHTTLPAESDSEKSSSVGTMRDSGYEEVDIADATSEAGEKGVAITEEAAENWTSDLVVGA